MRLFGLLVLVFIFVIMPLYALNTYVLPAIQNIQQVYTQASSRADQAIATQR